MADNFDLNETISTLNQLWHKVEQSRLEWVANVIELGNALIRIKAEVGHGNWSRLFESDEVKFSRNTATLYMRAAKVLEAMPSFGHVQSLPTDIAAISFLSSLEPDEITEAIEKGHISPDSNRSDMRNFVTKRQGKEWAGKQQGRPKPHHTLYVIESETNHIKIGISLNHSERWDSLERSGGFRVQKHYLSDPLPFAKEVESLLKAVFRNKQLRGEWFAADFDQVKRMAEAIILHCSLGREVNFDPDAVEAYGMEE